MSTAPSPDLGQEFESLLDAIRRRKDVLEGTLFSAFLPCNKGNCKCTRGELHGPTWRLSYRQDGKSSTVYVRQDDLESVQAAVRRYAEIRDALHEAGGRNLKALLRNVKRRRRRPGRGGEKG